MYEKFVEYFDPAGVKEQVHIIGCGAIGSVIAEQMARLGIPRVHLWDFDKVEEHNIANQAYTYSDIGKLKVDAIYERCTSINPRLKNQWIRHPEGWNKQLLHGHIFLSVDNIELRAKIVKSVQFSPSVKSVLDFRMRLEDAQHYAADWSDRRERKILLSGMDFTQEEADANTPVSACNMSLSIIPTVTTVVSVGLANWVNFINGKKLKRLIMVNPFTQD